MNIQTIAKRKMLKLDDVVESLVRWKQTVIEETIKMAEIYVVFIDQDRANKDDLRNKTKGLFSRTTLDILEGIGRGKYDPRVFDLVRNKRFVLRLPLSEQKDVMDGKSFPYLSADNTHINLKVRDCETKQAKQLFADDHIRNLNEQKVYVDELKKMTFQRESQDPKVEIHERKKIVSITGPMDLTFERFRLIALQLPHK
jgi:hypothetical protein